MLIEVNRTVNVELKQDAFTHDFMKDFRKDFYPFFTLDEHAQHIAQLVAREVIDEIEGRRGAEQFVEGYGPIGEFVKTALVQDTSMETLTADE